MSGVVVRDLAASDVAAAVALLNGEGWAFDEADVRRLLALGGGVVLEEDGRAVGLLTLVTHERLAWVGNVVVAPEARGRGLGERLVAGALARAASRGVESVGLYSVLPAVSLYHRAGFRDAGRVASYHGRGRPGAPPADVEAVGPADLAEVAAFDARANGDDRSRMLRTLVETYQGGALALRAADGALRGFVLAKPGASGSEIGPLVTRPGDGEAVEALLDAALAVLPDAPVEVGAPLANAPMQKALAARGFREAFPALAMYHGAREHEADHEAVAAVAGMEKG